VFLSSPAPFPIFFPVVDPEESVLAVAQLIAGVTRGLSLPFASIWSGFAHVPLSEGGWIPQLPQEEKILFEAAFFHLKAFC